MEKPPLNCPTEAEVRAEIPRRQRLFQTSGVFNFIRVFENPDFLLRYDLGDNIWAMCVKDVFTLDFDIKDGISRADAIRYVQNYSDIMRGHGVDMLWAVYESDRGMHFYLLSERLLYSDDRSIQTSLDLCTDRNYIVFSTFNGFCSRVAPKIKKHRKDENGRSIPGKDWMTDEEIQQEFVSLPCHKLEEEVPGLQKGEFYCTVGYGKPDPYVESILYVYERLIYWFLDAYKNRLPEQLEKQTYQWNGVKYENLILPARPFLEETKAFAQKLLAEVGIIGEGQYVIPAKYKGYLTEYKPFLDSNTLYKCARVHPFEINRRALNLVAQAGIENCAKQFISVAGIDLPDEQTNPLLTFPAKLVRNPTGKKYPFVFGVDGSSHMVFIQLGNLLMLDWDTKDGFAKVAAPQILNRFLRLEDSLSVQDRIYPGDLTFRLLETDNGVHAFCVSHPQVYNDVGTSSQYISNALNIMRHTCVDGWYIGFTKAHGYSIRIGPKIINRGKDGAPATFKSDEEIRSQFVQKYGVEVPGKAERLHYLGKGEIDPYLDSLVEFIYEIQQYVLRYPDLPRRAVEDAANLSLELGEFVKGLYDQKCRPLETARMSSHLQKMNDWAQIIWRCDPEKVSPFTLKGPKKDNE